MAANIRHIINGEKNRNAILDYLKGKHASSKEICIALGMTKSQLANYTISMQKSGHIVVCNTLAKELRYKRTNKPYYSMEAEEKKLDEVFGAEVDEVPDIKSDHARVIRLLSKPLAPPPPSKNRKSMYSGMQSSMNMFSMENGL